MGRAAHYEPPLFCFPGNVLASQQGSFSMVAHRFPRNEPSVHFADRFLLRHRLPLLAKMRYTLAILIPISAAISRYFLVQWS